MLTQRQKQILEYVKKFIKQKGYSPSLEDIRKHFRLSSKSGIHDHLKALEEKGYITRSKNKARSIEIVIRQKPSAAISIPLLGTIAAGEPIEEIEDPNETITLSQDEISSHAKHYVLRVRGNSMVDDGIYDGDKVVIREQKTADDGETVVAIIDDNQATLKKIYREKKRIRLQPANQEMLPIYRKEVEIRGIVIKIIRNLERLEPKTFTEKSFKDNDEYIATIKDGYERLKKYLDKLNFQNYHFVNSNDICTPMGCVEEMINIIPQDFWKKRNLKILDPCAGNGNFHAYIMTKAKLKNLWFNDINEKRLKNIKTIFGKDANVMEKDFLTFSDEEKYDLVVANPPYAKFTNGERTAKNHNLSRDFILKALSVTKDGGYVLFIIPDNWMSYADNNKVPSVLSDYQFIYLNIHGAKKWFPKVGSTFTWFLLQKVPNKKGFTVDNHYKIRKTERATLSKGVNFIPLYYSNLVKSIIGKTTNNDNLTKYKIQTSSNLHKYTRKTYLSNTQTNEYRYKIHHTPSQTIWSKVPHIYQNGWKVFISLTNQYGTFLDNCGMTQSIAFIRCSSKQEAEKVSQQLTNPLYIFLNNITRYGNFNNIRVLQSFPVYKDFGLTKKEKDFISEFSSNYYRSKRLSV